MSIHDIYSCKNLSVEECGVLLKAAIVIELTPHSSSHFGDYLLAVLPGGEEVRIVQNNSGDQWQEEDLRECDVIVKISDLESMNKAIEFEKKLRTNFTLTMRSEVIPRQSLRRYKFIEGNAVLLQEVHLKQG